LAERFPLVATGGTFDEIHIGHITLLLKAFEVGDKVIIGVSGDEFAMARGKKLNHNFDERVSKLKDVIASEFGNVNYEITKLNADFGPVVTSGNVSALITSSETENKGAYLNEMRARRGLKPVVIIAVGLVKAEDGSPISSTRIRAGEIDHRGRLIRKKGHMGDGSQLDH
jgi:pantetheine-phosphate adenylyltransferase